MTLVFEERDLQITINNAEAAQKFDEASTHGVSFMKAVDFIIEFSDYYLFVEFKDPQHPDSRLTGHEDLIGYYQSERIDDELVYKYRDTFLYEWASGRADRDVYYMVLIAIEVLTSAELDKKTKDLERKLPVGIPNRWVHPIVKGCGVFNIASWNARFPNFQVSRLSSQP